MVLTPIPPVLTRARTLNILDEYHELAGRGALLHLSKESAHACLRGLWFMS
jgi:hypothetical protein